jgi:5'-phosphate synthase pdxT subunit
MIMLATKIEENISKVKPLGIIDIDVIRNGYGRQVCSFEEKIRLKRKSQTYDIMASFIRAPKVTRAGNEVEVLAEFDGSPLLVRQGRSLAAAFHAELYDNTELLEYFLDLVLEPDQN